MKRLTTIALLAVAFMTAPSLAQRGGWDPGEMLTRMDKNKNGKLDRDEIDGRAEGWLKRYDSDLNFDKGVKIDKLKRTIQEARERRGRGDDRRGRDDDRRGRDDDDDDDDKPVVGIDILVAGFGEEVELPPVISFGSTPETYVEVTEANLRRARDTVGRYDSNKDGQLDRKERSRNSRWIGDPMQFDTNRDDKLSLQEMAVRYAQLDRIEKEKNASRSSDRDRRDRRRDDDDDEATVEIIRGGGPGSGYTTTEERLPEGLPDWFAEKDKNGDGQLSMAEFLSEVSTEEVAKFTEKDADNDGLLVAAELGVQPSEDSDRSRDRGTSSERRSSDRSDKSKRDSSRTASTSRDSGSRSSRYGSRSGSGSTKSTASSSNSSSSKSTEKKPEKVSADIDAKYQSYAAGRIKKYDANRDGYLSVEECKAGKPGLVEADANKDGKITTEEVARYYQKLYKR